MRGTGTRPPIWRAILIGWGIACAVLILATSRDIANLWFPDPDDAMRLNQVRDWMAGQSWWDVAQHRLNGGNFAMHWSRLVDLPLAAVIAGLRPLLGDAIATRVALTAIPLLALLAIMACAAALTRRLVGAEQAGLAVMLAALSVPIVYQVRPMRIDHHGWQIALAVAAVTALIGRRDRDARSGMLAGLALATLLTISLEGLPISAVIVAVVLLGWAIVPERRAQPLALLLTLIAALVLLHVTTRGPNMFAAACDAIAPGWIAALGVACGGAATALLLSPKTLLARLALLGAAGGAGLVTLLVLSPECTHGPFATLDPLVYRMWYQNVSEGLPVWQQVPAWGLMTISFPIVGMIGAALAWRSAEGDTRQRWALLIAIGAAGFVLSLLVMRTGATANALALPGGAWLLHTMLVRARAVSSTGMRTLATAGAYVLTTPGLAASALFSMPVAGTPVLAVASVPSRPTCDKGHDMASLARLPASTMFAPLDVTPALLAWTAHKAIASGYHRNAGAMHRVLATFLGDPVAARVNVLASRASYVVGCPGENETEIYKKAAPDGFWARLERGERFDWLVPVATGSNALAWRVIQPLSRPPSRPPFRPLPDAPAHP